MAACLACHLGSARNQIPPIKKAIKNAIISNLSEGLQRNIQRKIAHRFGLYRVCCALTGPLKQKAQICTLCGGFWLWWEYIGLFRHMRRRLASAVKKEKYCAS